MREEEVGGLHPVREEVGGLYPVDSLYFGGHKRPSPPPKLALFPAAIPDFAS